MGKTKIAFGIFLACLFLLTSVNAQPPLESSQNQYIIIAPIIEYHEQSQPYGFRIHVYNQSTGLILNDVSCELHLYGQDGVELWETNMSAVGFDYEAVADANNFTEIGQYSSIFYCNSTDFGGSLAYGFDVSGQGEVYNTAKALTSVFFLGLLVLLLIGCLIAIPLLPSKNEQDLQGNIMSINKLKYLRGVLFMVAYSLFMAITFMSSNLGYAYLGSEMFAKFFFTLYTMSMVALPVVLITWVVWIIVSIFNDNKFDKMLQRGIPSSSII